MAWISKDYLDEKELKGHLCDVNEEKLVELIETLISCELPEDNSDESKKLKSSSHVSDTILHSRHNSDLLILIQILEENCDFNNDLRLQNYLHKLLF